jgi:ssDNA-binding Zn-finger/Zn-ribbon topoisomerase 1
LALRTWTCCRLGGIIGTVPMTRRLKNKRSAWKIQFTAAFNASQTMNSKLQDRGRGSGVTICPLCKKRKLHFSRSADKINFDGHCTSPGCNFSWGF